MHFYFVGVRRCITLRQHLSHLRLFPLLLFSTAFATLFPSCCFSIRCSCSTLWYCQSLVRGSFTSSSSSSSSSSRFARSRTLSHPPDILLRVCTYGSLSALSSTLSLSLSLLSFSFFLWFKRRGDISLLDPAAPASHTRFPHVCMFARGCMHTWQSFSMNRYIHGRSEPFVRQRRQRRWRRVTQAM